jgi:hypothetical protein
MNRFAVVAWIGLACAALSCGGASRPTREPHDETDDACAAPAHPSVDAALSQRLDRAANVVEFESVWKGAHAGSTAGTIDRGQLTARIRSRSGEVQDCYEAALDELKDGSGRVAVRFVIDAKGRVPHVSVTSSNFDDPRVACCLVRRLEQWSFPAPAAGDFVVVEYPFTVRVSH